MKISLLKKRNICLKKNSCKGIHLKKKFVQAENSPPPPLHFPNGQSLKSKTSALQYLGQKSSTLSPKPLVRKLISLSFRRNFLVVAIFLISGFYLTINNYVLDHSNFPNIMSPGITVKSSG